MFEKRMIFLFLPPATLPKQTDNKLVLFIAYSFVRFECFRNENQKVIKTVQLSKLFIGFGPGICYFDQKCASRSSSVPIIMTEVVLTSTSVRFRVTAICCLYTSLHRRNPTRAARKFCNKNIISTET